LESSEFDTPTQPEVPAENKPGIGRFLIDIIETLVLSALLFLGINAVSARIRVDGYSMEPTLHSGEFVVVNKLAYKWGQPGYGDVIVFRYPYDPQQEFIKRVIGLPGDQIRIEDGIVYVNGIAQQEDYIAAPPAYQNNVTVPGDSYFVLGDNRNNSSDSHSWGPVPKDYVVGKALFVYWPPENWGTISHASTANASP
jgi:signal peptidase I